MADDNGQDPRGSSSILPRLLMALVIVLIGWFMYMPLRGVKADSIAMKNANFSFFILHPLHLYIWIYGVF
jgi:hypothetical protein